MTLKEKVRKYIFIGGIFTGVAAIGAASFFTFFIRKVVSPFEYNCYASGIIMGMLYMAGFYLLPTAIAEGYHNLKKHERNSERPPNR